MRAHWKGWKNPMCRTPVYLVAFAMLVIMLSGVLPNTGRV